MTETRRPGRPQIADLDAIAETAVALFAEAGYGAVTMDQIASASAVSRRTLFRHFPSKASLVWHNLFTIFDGMIDGMATEDAEPGIDGVRRLMRSSLTLEGEQEHDARVRLAIIGQNADVLAEGIEGLVDVREGIAAHLARSAALERGGLANAVGAVTVMNAMLVACTWWAVNSEDPLADVVDRALAAVADGVG